ncbi:MAG: 1,3-propanediol dehydrogenase DhaT [Thermoanaerobacterales bacterium 50_218]|nr:MAG: 1,3-propanediol dehydrogenase DhaT [Thermoanaerobacterales bacterium 50_218]HAA90479.1 iron-containing alcohol dehydrogenase [Peptococcaceae bacterium]
MLFDFLVPARIIFGPGSSGRLGEEACRFGRRVLLVTGKRSLRLSGMLDRVLAPLEAAKLDVLMFDQVDPEPSLEVVEKGREAAREQSVDLVVAAGGGSVLDVGKAIAGLFYEEGTVREYFEGRPIEKVGLPWIAVPTTAGSGAEATRNSVLIDPVSERKQSIRCDWWMARVAVVDPVLTMSMPPRLTAITGMDALTHAIEAYTSRWSHPLTSSLALEAAILISRNLYSAYQKGSNREAREKMSLASLMAGIALNNARLGAVHGLAHPIGLRYHLPHGLVCGILLPYVMEYNLTIVEEKYARIALELGLVQPGSSSGEAARRLIHFVKSLKKRLGIPEKLSEVGLRAGDLSSIAEAALPSGSLAANPRAARKDDLLEILKANL